MNHRHPDPNDNYPPSFKAEAEMEAETFRRTVIASLELAESALFDAAQALRNYPDYGHEASQIDVEIGRIEDLRNDIGGEG